MKRKVFSILFTLMLVMSFSLIPAVPVSADGASPRGMLGTTGTGEATWTQDTKQCGDYSAKLVWPASDRAFVSITGIPDDTTINDVTSWSYWVNVKDVETEHPGDGEDYCPNLTFYLDTDGDGAFNSDNDTTVTAWPELSIVTDWCQIDETTIGGYDGAYTAWEGGAGAPKWKFDWAAVQSSYGTQEILKLKVGKGVIGTGIALTVYADDLIMNGVTYEFEPPPTCYVSTTGSDNNLGTEEEPFATIQRGVNIVAESGTVNVANGNYNATSSPFVRITKSLTLIGESRDGVILDGTGTSTIDFAKGIHVTANNVTIKNLTVQNFGTVPEKCGYGVLFRDYDRDTPDEGYIYYTDCVVDNVKSQSNCYPMYALVNQNLTIQNCLIQNNLSDGMFIARESDNATITGNTVINSGDHGIWVGRCWEGLGPSDNATITNNIVDGAREGGITFCASDTATITGNTITNVAGETSPDGYSAGALSLIGDCSNVTATNNVIYNNCGTWGGHNGTGNGIGIWEGTPANIVLRDNDIYGNTGYGCYNYTGVSVDAKDNWWGHATGPEHATTNPEGRGDEVSDNVSYAHWYLVPKDDVAAGTETTVEETSYGQKSQEFTDTDTTVDTSGTSGDGDITVKTYDYTVPEDAEASLAASVEGKQALKYVDVKLENSTYSGDVCVTISYTDADLAQMGVEESDLALYYWDMPSGPWTLASSSSVDMVNNTVYGCVPVDKLGGTPLCLGGEAEATGEYTIGAPPTVTVTFADTEMDPMVEQTVTVGVSVPCSESRTLEELSQVLFKVWHDNNGGTPTETEFNDATADTRTGAIITWTPGDGFVISPMGGDTTWSLGTCTAPTLTGCSGTFTLKFTPGKVATETFGSAVWQIAATATSEYGTSDLGYDSEATAMNWYGELALGVTVNVDWGSVPAGMNFDNAMADQSLDTTITIISNGDCDLKTKSSATWEGISNTATLDSDGACDTAKHFALKAASDGTLPTQGVTGLLDTSGVAIATVPYVSSTFVESGMSYAEATLWLKLADTFAQDTYSGTITYMIQNGAGAPP